MSDRKPGKARLVSPSVGQCVWVDAGVISYKLCTLNYECERCSLHQALVDGPILMPPTAATRPNRMEATNRRAELEGLFEKLPAQARKCRHMLSGEVSYKLCINRFRCSTCSFGQMMEDGGARDRGLPVAVLQDIGGFRVPGGVHYHRAHTWIQVGRDGAVRVGLDDLGQWLSGTIEGIRLPAGGDPVFEGAAAWDLRTRAGDVGVLAPISGQVIATNDRLREQPGLVNASPYTDGWLFLVKPNDLSGELCNLLFGQEARDWFEHEVTRVGDRIRRGGEASMAAFEHDVAWRDEIGEEMMGEFLLARPRRAA